MYTTFWTYVRNRYSSQSHNRSSTTSLPFSVFAENCLTPHPAHCSLLTAYPIFNIIQLEGPSSLPSFPAASLPPPIMEGREREGGKV
mmetsp:Transcript_43375/g.112842  ORF Transcript_43375/g.112842 Transcript_43375/m.112842 type:complete len:87 (-) Transcript_43375:1925-2185(-)